MKLKGYKKIIKLLSAGLAAGVIITPMQAFATNGGYLDESAKYTIKVTWNVDNPCSYDGNDLDLLTFAKDDIPNYSYDYEDGYYSINIFGDHTVAANPAKDKGEHTDTYTAQNPPCALRYRIEGDGTHISKFYVTKVELQTLNPVAGTGRPTDYVLFDGKYGLQLKDVVKPWDDPHTVSGEIEFGGSAPILKDWTNDHGSQRCRDINSYSTEAYGGPRNEYKQPLPLGVTDISAPAQINVPTDNKDSSTEFSEGVYYDQYGAKSPVQKATIETDRQDKGVDVTNNGDKWYIKLSPQSNASEDYTVKLSQHEIYHDNYNTSTEFTVHTFDYNFTFLDENGKEIANRTADYGESVTAPELEANGNVAWSCDEYSDWQNTTNGPQNRTVRATVTTNVQAAKVSAKAGKKKITINWSKFRDKVKNSRCGRIQNMSRFSALQIPDLQKM